MTKTRGDGAGEKNPGVGVFGQTSRGGVLLKLWGCMSKTLPN